MLAKLQGAIEVREVIFSKKEGASRLVVHVHATEYLPTNVAFECSLWDGKREWAARDFLTGRKDKKGHWGWLRVAMPDVPMPATFEVILRSSAKAAQSTTHLTEVWDGELRFPAVRVTEQKAKVASPAATTLPSSD